MGELQASQGPIVVAVDGSERDADAVRLGGRIAGLRDAPIVIAHAHPYGSIGGLLGEGQHERVIRDLAERVLDQASAHLEGAKVSMRLLADRSPARALHRLAASERAGIIVVGASERGRLGLTRPGSTSERIVRGSPAPVAVAPAGYATNDSGALDCIGCGFDAEPPARAALRHAAALAVAAHARLRMIAVFEPLAFGHVPVAYPSDLRSVNAARRDTLARRLHESAAEIRGLDIESVLLDGDPGEQLVSQTASLDALVVGSRGYGAVRSVLLGGVSGHVIRTARCPVVVCPAEDAE